MSKSEPRWTKGPWQVAGVRHSGDLRIGKETRLQAVGPDGDAVAMVFFDMKTGRGLSDASLIAASPDLYAALKAVHDLAEGSGPFEIAALNRQVLAALSKANPYPEEVL